MNAKKIFVQQMDEVSNVMISCLKRAHVSDQAAES